jgi:CheY-like chemotaxis protein
LLALVEQMLADRRVSTTKTSSARASTNVLIVEDNDDWRADLVRYLPPVDRITTAADYPTAAEMVNGHPFDLAIIDLRLVDSDDDDFQGMNLMRLIREKDKERGSFTQMIIVSAYGTTEHIRQAYKDYGTYYYFDKRYLSPAKYRESVRVALAS